MRILLQTKYTALSAQQQKISEHDAEEQGFFGPVYHGTTATGREAIQKNGFKIFVGAPREGTIQNGYVDYDYSGGLPAPIHHLGFGIYFTTVLAIAKRFNNNSAVGLKKYYLRVPNLEVINFGSQSTMVRWWVANGYDVDKIKDRLQATVNLTNRLKAKYDAVWYQGKGVFRLLDGDQIVVFNTENIYEVDPTLSKPYEVGSKVKRKSDGMVGVIVKRRKRTREAIADLVRILEENSRIDVPAYLEGKQLLEEGTIFDFFDVRWKRGGVDYNNVQTMMDPA